MHVQGGAPIISTLPPRHVPPPCLLRGCWKRGRGAAATTQLFPLSFRLGSQAAERKCVCVCGGERQTPLWGGGSQPVVPWWELKCPSGLMSEACRLRDGDQAVKCTCPGRGGRTAGSMEGLREALLCLRPGRAAERQAQVLLPPRAACLLWRWLLQDSSPEGAWSWWWWQWLRGPTRGRRRAGRVGCGSGRVGGFGTVPSFVMCIRGFTGGITLCLFLPVL